MKPDIPTINRLKEFFQTQKLTVLATQEPGHPYLSLMAFAVTDNLKYLIIATNRGTRKYSNLAHSPGVAFLIDNRSPGKMDFQNTLAVTGIGRAQETEESEKRHMTAIFLEKHPELEAFVKSPECALIKVTMERYILISQFQEAEEIELS